LSSTALSGGTQTCIKAGVDFFYGQNSLRISVARRARDEPSRPKDKTVICPVLSLPHRHGHFLKKWSNKKFWCILASASFLGWHPWLLLG
jgi:hypothetical protein